MILPNEAVAAPAYERPSLWRRLLAAFRDEAVNLAFFLVAPLSVPSEHRAHVVITLDVKTLEILHVNIYSCTATQLTVGSTKQCHLDGPSASGASYEEAARNLVSMLKTISFFGWMFDRLPDRYRELEAL